MQTYFSETLQNIQQDLETTASYHITQQAQLVDQAKKALESATTATRGTTRVATRVATQKIKKGGVRSEEMKKATEQLAAAEQRKKTLEQMFAQYREVLRKAAL